MTDKTKLRLLPQTDCIKDITEQDFCLSSLITSSNLEHENQNLQAKLVQNPETRGRYTIMFTNHSIH